MTPRLEQLREDECWRLLAEQRFGRVAIVVDAVPVVVPVNYVVSGSSVVFRVAPGSLLDPTEAGRPAAFEVDATRPEYHAGWSVLLRGCAEQVGEPSEAAACARLPLRPWVAHTDSVCVRIVGEVTGRRIPSP